MLLPYRRILLIASFVAFIILVPIVVFYAIGYRQGLTTERNAPVGVLLIETVPRRVDIEVNGTRIGRTPKAVPGLLPGLVNVRLTKEGYIDWEKEIAIKPRRVTELRNVRLFPAKPRPTALAANVSSFTVSPNRERIASLENQNQLVIRDDFGEILTNPVLLPSPPVSMLWSPDSSLLLLQSQDKIIWLYNIASPNQGLTVLPALQTAKNIIWDPRVPGRLLAQTVDGHIAAYNLVTQSTDSLIEDVGAFATSSRNIYTSADGSGTIFVYSLQGEKVRDLKTDITQRISRLLITPAGRIAILTSAGTLAVFDENQVLNTISEEVISAGWSPDGQMLYVQSRTNELHVYNAANERVSHIPLKQLRLITRLSRPIREAQWFAGSQHLVYQVEDEIFITEIDTRDHPVTYTVDTTNIGDARAAVGQEGEWLYYLKKEDGANSLIRTPLVVDE